jgi:hypothetical protein
MQPLVLKYIPENAKGWKVKILEGRLSPFTLDLPKGGPINFPGVNSIWKTQ